MSMNNTKRSLVINALSILLCLTMLLGTTFAWFTDTVASSTNRIIAGNLKIDLLMDKGSGYVSIADGKGDIFNETDDGLWEPGKTKVAYLAVQNKGNHCGAILGYVQDLGNGLSISDVILKNVEVETYMGSYLIGSGTNWGTGTVSNITATGAKFNCPRDARILTDTINAGVTVSGLNIKTDSLNGFETLVVVPDGNAAGSVSGKIVVGAQEYQIPDNYTGGRID